MPDADYFQSFSCGVGFNTDEDVMPLAFAVARHVSNAGGRCATATELGGIEREAIELVEDFLRNQASSERNAARDCSLNAKAQLATDLLPGPNSSLAELTAAALDVVERDLEHREQAALGVAQVFR